MIAVYLLLVVVAGIMGQRSPYLATDTSYPGLLTRFKPANASGLGDRIGGSESPYDVKPSSEGGAQGTLYDQATIDRVATWPEDKQPFWFKNRQHIAQQIGNNAKRNGSVPTASRK